jgi:hypothetical protein
VSSSSNIQLWGQAWELTVKYTAGGNPDDPVQSPDDTQIYTLTTDAWQTEGAEPLRMTFDVEQRAIRSPYWSADITIYNLNQDSIQNILFNATWATLKAGFQTGPNVSSTIWDGPVFQVLYDRENVVDQRIQLRCIASPLLNSDIVSFSMGPYSSQLDFVNRMAQQINLPEFNQSQNGNLGPKAAVAMAKQYPRGYGAFGGVAKYLQQIADDNFMQSFMDGSKVYISELSKSDYTPDLIYSPPPQDGSSLPSGVTGSIIGTPRQTPFGVIFTVLLDPRLKVQLPPLVVQIQRSLISQFARPLPSPNSTPSTPFSNDLTFLVSQIRHVGDTRGNDWQTEVTGYSTTYAEDLLNGVFAANSMG